MAMEKYATYKVFKHKTTGELRRVPLENTNELEKTASTDEWIELDVDPRPEVD
jgi:hypothetical protein